MLIGIDVNKFVISLLHVNILSANAENATYFVSEYVLNIVVIG